MLHQFPFLRITGPLIAGVVTYEYLPSGMSFYGVCYIILLIGMAVSVFGQKHLRKFLITYTAVYGVVATFCLFAAGYVYVGCRKIPVPAWNLEQKHYVKVRLADAPQRREKSSRVEAELLRITDRSRVCETSGKILLYFSKKIVCDTWGPGDELILFLQGARIEGPKNPGEFDLERYNRRKGIHWRAFVDSGQVLAHEPQRGFLLTRLFWRLETYMTGISARYFRSPSEKAVADALILGYKDDLDEETLTRFSRSGTSHVLAVSGLHVGILWLIVDKLLLFLDRRKALRILKFVLSLAILWGYASLTGLSPSVLRSAIMFSCFAFSGLLKQRYASFNILCASAGMQVLIDPFVLFNAGFQLSYAAVAGILLLQRPIRNALYVRRKIPRMLWDMAALTLAAQLTTMPVSLYWFGQFPVWFLFSNLPIVPLSGLALQLGLAAYVLEWVPYLGTALFHLFVLSIKLMDGMADFFSELPGALLYVRVSLSDAFLLYFFIAAVSLFLLKKKPVRLKISLGLTCLYLFSSAWGEVRSLSRDNWVFYALKDGSVIRRHVGHRVYEYRSPNVDRKGYGFSVSPSDKFFVVRTQIPVKASGGFLSFGSRRIVLLQPRHLRLRPIRPVSCDWIVLEGIRFVDFDALQQNFRFDKLLISGSNSYKARRRWKKECIRRNIPFYDLREAGAWICQKSS